MKTLLCILVPAVALGAGFQIFPGDLAYGPHRAYLTSTVTVTLSGSQPSTRRAYTYYSMDDMLSVALPPGITGTCTGTPCNIFTTDLIGGGSFATTGFPGTSSDGNYYFVDPVFNTTATTSGAVSLFASAPVPNSADGVASGTFSLATRFHSDRNGFIVGVRFYRPAGDTATGQIGTLWSDAGTSLATATFIPSGSGWQTANFSTPVAITAGTIYRLGYQTTGTVYYRPGFFKSSSYAANGLHSEALYQASNGTCGYTDGWPRNADGDPSAGIVVCVDVSSTAGIAGVQGGDQYDSYWLGNEGTNMMVGPVGPGPYAMINSYLECVGNCWHHSDEGYDQFYRSSYTYTRNVFLTPPYARPGGDGNQYSLRQLWETKGGEKFNFVGNTFMYSYNDVAQNSLTMAFSNVHGEGVRDVDMNYNEFAHVPGIAVGPTDYETAGDYLPIAPPPNRYRFRNMLAWDVSPKYAMPGKLDGNSWFIEGGDGAEDLIIDHVTMVGNGGRVPVILHYGGPDSEMSVTNSIFYIDSTRWGADVDGEVESGPEGARWATCPKDLTGEALIRCKNPSFLVWKNNLMFPNTSGIRGNPDSNSSINDCGGAGCVWFSNATQASVQSHWPTLSSQNYIPNTTDLNQVGWFKWNTDNSGAFNLKNSSPYISGGPFHATDGTDVGVDMIGLRRAQGKVDVVGVANSSFSCTTTCSAVVTFIAPDQQACPVDFSSSDATLINSFTRATDSGSAYVRNVTMSGLTRKTTYHARIDCAAEQPTVNFITP